MSGPADLQRRFYDMLMESQYWPPDRLRDYQRSQLAQLLRHAKAQVPFYEHRLDAVLKPNGDVDWDRWNDIPILTRDDLQTHHDAMQARDLPAGHGPVSSLKSSGSTGVPIETSHTSIEGLASLASVSRADHWFGVDTGKSYLKLSGEDPGFAAWPDGAVLGRWGTPWAAGTGLMYQLNNLTAPEDAADFLAAGRYAYVSAMPSRFEPIARVLEARGQHVPLDTIFTRGEGVTAAQRQLFGDVFGARLAELYAAEEAFKLGTTCPDHGPSYHVNAELGLVEIVDATGRQVAPGQQGNVVVTPFYNTAQPLIRYALGDLAVAGAPCSCGRGLPVIEKIVGRTYHLFRRPDGGRFVPIVLEKQSFELGFRTWQLAQVAPDLVEFRYVMPPGRSAEPAAIEAMIRSGLPPGFRIRLVELDAFHTPPGRKHILLVNELATADGPPRPPLRSNAGSETRP
jgi:phenylacetate-CoA ligase